MLGNELGFTYGVWPIFASPSQFASSTKVVRLGRFFCPRGISDNEAPARHEFGDVTGT
jgi:hypothetical protein